MTRRGIVALVLALALGLAPLVLGPALPAVAAAPASVKYYQVHSSFAGRPERLWDIAERFLGNGSRYVQILELNQDRPQPGGGRLTNPDVLEAGWLLVLPWDATGADVHYGLLPADVATPTAPCDARPPPPAAVDIPWAQLRLAPTAVWPKGRGRGVTVAVIDSGVNASVAALAGRVLAGADVTPGGRQGTGDCLGHGTAMAALVAARPGGDPEFTGMAPDATVLPIRVDLSGGSVPAGQAAEAIRVALAAKADVIMVAPHIQRVDGAVVAAIHAAEEQDVVVVLPAGSVEGTNVSGGAVIRVGGVGVDGVGVGAKAARRAAGVDVVAPGVDVSSLGPGGVGLVRGTGEDYATAFVAGLVALVRSVQPAAPAAQVVQMILSTADPIAATESRDGSRFINPIAAAQLAADWSADRPSPPFALTRGAWPVILLVLIVGLIVAGFGWRRRPAVAMYPGPRQEPDPGRAGIEICE